MSHAQCIQFLLDLPGETISPSELAKVLGGRPYLYNVMARDGSLPFMHMWRGRNLRIIKQSVLDVLIGSTGYKEEAGAEHPQAAA